VKCAWGWEGENICLLEQPAHSRQQSPTPLDGFIFSLQPGAKWRKAEPGVLNSVELGGNRAAFGRSQGRPDAWNADLRMTEWQGGGKETVIQPSSLFVVHLVAMFCLG
jgi:hypothetical protein